MAKVDMSYGCGAEDCSRRIERGSCERRDCLRRPAPGRVIRTQGNPADDASSMYYPGERVRRGIILDDSKARKESPLYSGVLKYFPDALFEVAALSQRSNEKHNPGQPLHWSKDKSNDHLDCIARHLVDLAAGHTFDPENKCSPLVSVAWRALAALQIEIEESRRGQGS